MKQGPTSDYPPLRYLLTASKKSSTIGLKYATCLPSSRDSPFLQMREDFYSDVFGKKITSYLFRTFHKPHKRGAKMKSFMT